MIKIHLNSQSQPIIHRQVKNTYTKDGLYCVYVEDNQVFKYPLVNIFRITESYKDVKKSVIAKENILKVYIDSKESE